MLRACSLSLALFALAACPPQHAGYCSEPLTSADAGSGLTYHRDVKPIIERRCGRCHQPGGIAPFSLLGFGQAVGMRGPLAAAVTSRRMPPWPPARCCTEYQHDKSLSDAERATLLSWVDQGAVEGSATTDDGGVSQPTALSRVDETLSMAKGYLPAPAGGKTDETRCFLLDWPQTATRYVTGLDVRPGVPSMVHHALVLLASKEDVAALEKLDAADPGEGWSCPGSIVRFSGYLGGWTPGFDAQEFPPGLGYEVQPGQKVILSVHYSLHEAAPLKPDLTQVQVKFQAEPTRPMKAIAVYDLRWPFGGMRIPAGSSDTRYHYSFDPTDYYSGGKPMLLHGVTLHMHSHGTKGTVAILRKDGTTECLLQVDAYDDKWQGDYTFLEPKRLAPGDHLFIECQWDNTQARQPLVNGVVQAPKDLNWAEDSEMCLSFVTASVAP